MGHICNPTFMYDDVDDARLFVFSHSQSSSFFCYFSSYPTSFFSGLHCCCLFVHFVSISNSFIVNATGYAILFGSSSFICLGFKVRERAHTCHGSHSFIFIFARERKSKKNRQIWTLSQNVYLSMSIHTSRFPIHVYISCSYNDYWSYTHMGG